jgi:hypothetical protein
LIYLSGKLPHGNYSDSIGVMAGPHTRQDYTADQWKVWAADNGCFSKSADFDLDVFLAWLQKMWPHRDRCLFAVAPDVLGDAAATLLRSRAVFPVIRAFGYKAALVAQDGFDLRTVPWDEFDCLFIGGSTEFKLSETAYSACLQAKHRGKWVHMGRVNSETRLEIAAIFGCDSVDGTFICFGPDKNTPLVERWLKANDTAAPGFFV